MLVPKAIRWPAYVVCAHKAKLREDERLNALHAAVDLATVTANCRDVADRLALLQLISMCGTCAEVGVAQGDFPDENLKICQPARLHPIDTLESASGVSGKVGAVAVLSGSNCAFASPWRTARRFFTAGSPGT